MATVGTITVTMNPTNPPFSGSLAVGGTHASSFAISSNQLVTVGNPPAGNYNITITATQPGTTGSPRTQNFTITGVSGGGPVEPPPLPAVPSGQTGHDVSWVPGGGTVGNQTSPQAYNVTFPCRVARAVVRLTTSNTTPLTGNLGYWSTPTGSISFSNGFALNQAPGLIEVTGIDNRIINAGEQIYFQSGYEGTTSAATARIFIQPADGGGPTDGYLFPINATGTLTHSWTAGQLSNFPMDWSGGLDLYLSSSARSLAQMTLTVNNTPGSQANRQVAATMYRPSTTEEVEFGWVFVENPTSGQSFNLLPAISPPVSLSAGYAIWLGFIGNWSGIAATLQLVMS